MDQCITINNYREHQRAVNRLTQPEEPAIVIAASGICTGGRILIYLQAVLPDKRADVIFAVYQAKGTLGNYLQNIQPSVNIDKTSIPVKAQIHSISGYSAHADQEDLIEFIKRIENHRKKFI
ncbi:MBL fold metallo-hydrolase RNA specificity domain-containing protein [Vibrio amylolyticus]|uniref:MBL fold metallo-hydrolase RNA specificity domain-containing protein n=1 Tax=Vibrio amylolyticus TaxID=2847292 RepID=UPI003550A732